MPQRTESNSKATQKMHKQHIISHSHRITNMHTGLIENMQHLHQNQKNRTHFTQGFQQVPTLLHPKLNRTGTKSRAVLQQGIQSLAARTGIESFDSTQTFHKFSRIRSIQHAVNQNNSQNTQSVEIEGQFHTQSRLNSLNLN